MVRYRPTINYLRATAHLLFRLLTDDGGFSDLQKGFFRALDNKTRVFHFLDPTNDTTVGDDLVVYLKLRDHLLKLLLLALLRQDHKKIENTKDKNERQQRPQQTASAVLKH